MWHFFVSLIEKESKQKREIPALLTSLVRGGGIVASYRHIVFSKGITRDVINVCILNCHDHLLYILNCA